MDKIVYFELNFFISCMFLLVFILYFIIFLLYLFYSLCKKYSNKLMIYWIEYGLFNFSIITYLTIYIIYLSQIRHRLIPNETVILSCFDNDINSYCLSIYLMAFTVSMLRMFNIVVNCIQSILLCIGMTSISKEKMGNVQLLKAKFQVNHAMHTINNRRIITIHGICLVGLIIGSIFFIKLFPRELTPELKVTRSLRIGINVLRIVQVIMMITVSVVIYMLKYYKKQTMNVEYYTSNPKMQATYNIYLAKIIFYSDFLTYKCIVDFVNAMPSLISFSIQRASIIILVFSYLIFLSYLFFIGGIFAYVDKVNKVAMLPKIRRFFLLDRMRFDFGEKEKAKLFEEFLLDIDDESRLFNDFSMTIEDDSNQTNINDNDNDPTENDSDGDNTQSHSHSHSNSNSSRKKRHSQSSHHYHFINFYMIFNCLYQFFAENQKEFRKKTEDIRYKEINSIFKYDTKNMFEEDDDLIDEFNEIYPNEDHVDFTFESLYNEQTIKLFKIFELDIKDIMQSLNPSDNRNEANECADKRKCDKRFNFYETHDELLYYEIYKLNRFPMKDIKNFLTEYSQYLNKQLKNHKGTFLPLIIGIFKFRFLTNEQVIILFRNPIAYSHFVNKSNWLKFTLSENQEKINTSSTSSSKPIDIGEIDVKNTIKFSHEQYRLISNQLCQDMYMIQSAHLKCYPKVNVYVVKEGNGKLFVDSFNGLYSKDSFMSDLDSDVKYKDSCGSKYMPIMKEYDRNAINSFDILYTTHQKSQGFITKIYISDLFRKRIIVKVKENTGHTSNYHSKPKSNNDKGDKEYFESLHTQLMNIFGKESSDVINNSNDHESDHSQIM